MKIAVMPGDGVGKEVVPEGLKVLAVAAKSSVSPTRPPTIRSGPSTI